MTEHYNPSDSWQGEGVAASGRPPATPGSEVEKAAPVYDAELIDESRYKPLPPLDDGAARSRTRRARLVSWWLRNPRVPAALKSRVHARQAVRDCAVRVIRSPWRFLLAVLRGLVTVCRMWRVWITVSDFRAAAEESGKLADKFGDIRTLTLFRWKVTGSVLAAVAFAGVAVWAVYGWRPLWIGAGLVPAVLAVAGRRKDGSPGRKPALAGPRSLTWTMDPQVLVDAFRDARLIGKDESLRLVERACRVGEGWAITVDLPATRKAADVIKHREALASALAVDEVQLIVERVRSNGGHAGRWLCGSPMKTRMQRRRCGLHC